ncbi:MAG: acyl carrier protein [Acidimicrobiia bacterium]
MDVTQQVVEIITGVLTAGGRSSGVVTATSMMGDPFEWDSLAFVEIFVTVSGHYDLEVSDDDAMSFMSVPEIVDFVSQRL